MAKRLGKIFSTAVTAIIAALLLCNVYTIVLRTAFDVLQPSVFGVSTAVVITGSMEPAVSVNDMVVIHEQESYEPGDIVSYQSGSMLVTHRVTAVTDGGYITRGDANNTDDGEIAKEAVVGRVVLVIPKVGYAIAFLQTPLGMLVMTGVLFALVALPMGRKEESEE